MALYPLFSKQLNAISCKVLIEATEWDIEGFLVMRRDEAVNLLKELSDKCTPLIPFGIALMPPDSDDVLSQGFQIHIFAVVDQETVNCIQTILEKHNSKLKQLQEKNMLVIYRQRT